MNGTLADSAWKEPKVSLKSKELARKNMDTDFTKTEFKDSDEVLKKKVALMAKMIKKSKTCVMYVGAGMSTSAGINDYATAGAKKVETRNRLEL